MNILMFYLFASVIVIFSILTVTSRRILRSAVFLLFVLIATSAFYFMLRYTFLAAAQLALYAGGIVVLIIFSILLTSHISERFPQITFKKAFFSALVAGAGAVLSIVTLLQFDFDQQYDGGQTAELPVRDIGKSLMDFGEEGFVLPFEVISILLLAAMIGAIVIAKKKKD
ncbi:MAG TPA: NADH-quinone oxidoreductase subunit J [Bacteroidales bacterium]|nr:NADH-quinone oxidoreductase subunit J [Bacteroidales bacterium]HNQ83934.1 NADH-quinone oxidoreductase subunit J [Bacteroidales bacterium]HOX78412.1 NADH-quinone oxidoreductase subunit J [Bacteroidales bacterium]HPI85602.1 NADH-quinone oxidoreductase subunit J [Bacteroidales bacterium]HPM93811.1 NADH-quinone oxidoreductase subunit J [Bacteroidales bacterium]